MLCSLSIQIYYKNYPYVDDNRTKHNKFHLQLAPFASHAYWLINIYNSIMTGIF